MSRLIDSQRLGERADRLLRGANHQRLAVGHARFEAAGVVRGADEAEVRRVALRFVVVNRVVNLRAAAPGRFEAEADLDAFDRLHGHHRLGEPAVELAVPLGMRAEAERQAFDAHLDDAAERVALFAEFRRSAV